MLVKGEGVRDGMVKRMCKPVTRLLWIEVGLDFIEDVAFKFLQLSLFPLCTVQVKRMCGQGSFVSFIDTACSIPL